MPNIANPDRSLVAHKGKALGTSLQIGRVESPPPARSTWRDEVIESYEAYWEDTTSGAARRVDVAKIVRYFDMLELEARMYDELIMETSLVDVDDNGRRSANPLIASLARIVGTSIRLANEIGATPLSRIKLGLTAAEGQMAMAALEAKVGGQLDPEVKQVYIEETNTMKAEEDEVYDAEVIEEW